MNLESALITYSREPIINFTIQNECDNLIPRLDFKVTRSLSDHFQDKIIKNQVLPVNIYNLPLTTMLRTKPFGL